MKDEIYRNNTAVIDQVIEQYKDFKFDSNTYNKLKNIIHKMVRYNIVEQIKEEI